MRQASGLVRVQDVEWTEFAIPESAPPVSVARLREDRATRALTLLVRFAAGWSRPVAGFYESDEEFLVLEGDLSIGESGYFPGDYVWIPAGVIRGPSSSREGALAVAHFAGPARWNTGDPSRASIPAPNSMLSLRWEEVVADPSPLGIPARRIRGEGPGSIWVIEDTSSATAPSHAAVEGFSLADRSWTWVLPGRAISLAGPCICWLRDPGQGR